MLRFIPLGQLVSRVAIHLFSLIFLRTVSFLQILSINTTWTSSIVWPWEFKWAATGFSILCLMSMRWLFILSFSALTLVDMLTIPTSSLFDTHQCLMQSGIMGSPPPYSTTPPSLNNFRHPRRQYCHAFSRSVAI